jgi:hypothetical protein
MRAAVLDLGVRVTMEAPGRVCPDPEAIPDPDVLHPMEAPDLASADVRAIPDRALCPARLGVES